MVPKIKIIDVKKLVGIKMTMSLAENKTGELWKSWMQRQHEIPNRKGNEKISMQVYGTDYFKGFNPKNEFVKWAACEVTNFENIPEGMETFELSGGLYAVFQYKGLANEGAKVFGYIFGEWLPHSDYQLDNRPHFEVLGEKYNNENASSEEEIYIPVSLKKQ